MVEKVLIIDASATSRIALKARLALTYATVREARSAEEGLQSLRDGPSPDLILLGALPTVALALIAAIVMDILVELASPTPETRP